MYMFNMLMCIYTYIYTRIVWVFVYIYICTHDIDTVCINEKNLYIIIHCKDNVCAHIYIYIIHMYIYITVYIYLLYIFVQYRPF